MLQPTELLHMACDMQGMSGTTARAALACLMFMVYDCMVLSAVQVRYVACHHGAKLPYPSTSYMIRSFAPLLHPVLSMELALTDIDVDKIENMLAKKRLQIVMRVWEIEQVC